MNNPKQWHCSDAILYFGMAGLIKKSLKGIALAYSSGGADTGVFSNQPRVA